MIELNKQRIEASRASSVEKPKYKVPVKEGLSLMPYQIAGLDYMLGTPSAKVLVADDMGLGKTVEAISYINYMYQPGHYFGLPFLIICPATLKQQWKEELEKWLVKKMPIGIVHAGEKFPPAKIVIINYELIHKFKESLDMMTWEVMVIDEAHRLQNPKSIRTCAIYGGKCEVSEKGKKKSKETFEPIKYLSLLLLTGTPMKNRPVNLWPHLKVLAPSKWNNFMTYAKRYCAAKNGFFGWDTTGSSNEKELQDYLRSNFMLRRLKTDVLDQLPEKIVTWVPFTNVKRKYNHLIGQGKIDFEELAGIRAETGLAKVEFAVKFIKDRLEVYDKVLVFTHHKDVTAEVSFELSGRTVSLIGGICGTTPDLLRKAQMDTFKYEKGPQVLVGTMDTIGEGHNFQHADIAIFVEFDWSSEKCRQAEDRLLRLGREKPAEIFYLHLKGSIDDRIKAVMSGKKKNIKEAIG